MRRLLAVASLAVFASPAFALTVDSAGAARLADGLARYVSKAAFDTGILKVSVAGDAYRLDVDFKTLAGLFDVPDTVAFAISSYGLKLRPQANGTWQVQGALFPDGWVQADIDQAKQRVEWSITDGKMSGTFDPELAVFSSATGTHGGIRLNMTGDTGSGETSYGPGSFTMTATKSANGGVDFAAKQVMASYADTRTITEPGSNVSFPIAIKAASVALDSSGTGAKPRPMLDLLAFVVANPEPEKIKAKQEELKRLLLAALPLWDRMNGSYSLADLSVTSPVGIFRAAEIGAKMDMDGVRQDGAINYGVRLSKMEVASIFLPAWARGLLPTDAEINLGGRNIDLDAPARTMIAELDLTKEPPVPQSVSDAIMAGFQADPPTLVLSRSTLRNAETEFVAEGEMRFPGGKPSMQATIEAKGFDSIVSKIQGAAESDQQVAEILPVVLMAKGFGKTLPDGRLQWVVDVADDGSVRVNGVMLKQPDPQ